MQHPELKRWLQEADPTRLDALWRHADDVRRLHVGDAVHLRGLIELSNYCGRLCGYCGLRADNRDVPRYRMSHTEIVACARRAATLGFGTVVLQAGEDAALTREWVAELIRRIKTETNVAITLSLGERDTADLANWRAAGADRYLLRFETSDRSLFDRIHPPRNGQPSDRIARLHTLRELSYEVGSGVMIGIPGQSFDSLARDVKLFRDLNLDMIGVGPYIAHPATPLGRTNAPPAQPADEQVPNTAEMTCKVMALARIVCPAANIPSTTALATIGGADGQFLALQRGANVIMPNLTPRQYRLSYQIYPDKACFYDQSEENVSRLGTRLHNIGRQIGTGRGDSPNWQQRTTPSPSPAGRRCS